MATLKSLQTKLHQLKSDLEVFKQKESQVSKQIQQTQDAIAKVEHSISKLTKREIVVSEHAILRYLERIEGIDMEEVCRKILPDAVKQQSELIGDGNFPVNGHTVRIKSRVVMTVVANKVVK